MRDDYKDILRTPIIEITRVDQGPSSVIIKDEIDRNLKLYNDIKTEIANSKVFPSGKFEELDKVSKRLAYLYHYKDLGHIAVSSEDYSKYID